MSSYQPYPPTQYPGYYVQPEPNGQYPVMVYPQVMMPPEHPQATTVLVLGILGLVVAGILGPFAWYMGNKALAECATGMYTATDQLRAGRVLGIVGTALLIVSAIATIVMLIIFAMFLGAVANY